MSRAGRAHAGIGLQYSPHCLTVVKREIYFTSQKIVLNHFVTVIFRSVTRICF